MAKRRIKLKKPEPEWPPTIPNFKDPRKQWIAESIALGHSILLEGDHGVGKTTILLDVIKAMGLEVKRMNASTLDPFMTFGIVPVEKANGDIEFKYDSDLNRYHVFFIDEINRAPSKKVLNAIYDLVQFKQVNGRSFDRLKAVVSAMNPASERYDVDDLPLPLEDRFDGFLHIDAIYSAEWYAEHGIHEDLAFELVKYVTISKELKKKITPRRLEIIGKSLQRNLHRYEFFEHSFISGSASSEQVRELWYIGRRVMGVDKKKEDMSGIIAPAMAAQLRTSNPQAIIDEIARERGN